MKLRGTVWSILLGVVKKIQEKKFNFFLFTIKKFVLDSFPWRLINMQKHGNIISKITKSLLKTEKNMKRVEEKVFQNK